MNTADEISEATRCFLQLFAANDVRGIAGCYTEDAQMLVANMNVIRGRNAIESVFKFTAGQGHTLEFQTHELDVQGATAIDVGRYIRRRADGSLFDDGKYMVVWKRVGEQWKLHRDMFNTSLPKAAAPTAEWKAELPRSTAL
jgi:ketosteroid isomerase-like protein